MVHSTKRGTGIIGTVEKPLEAVTFEASIEHSATALLSFIGKIRAVSGASLADYVGQNMVLEIDGVPAILDLVAGGAGCAVLSRNAVASPPRPAAFSVRRIETARAPRRASRPAPNSPNR